MPTLSDTYISTGPWTNVLVLCHATRKNFKTQQHNATACECQAGYQPVPNTTALDACVPCALGYFKSHTGNYHCQQCAIGQFSNTTGSTTCTQCAHVVQELGIVGATTTPEDASTSIQNCTCHQGHYLDNAICTACVRGDIQGVSWIPRVR
jgi:hypothetical protein